VDVKKITFSRVLPLAQPQPCHLPGYKEYPGYLLVSASHPEWKFVVCRRSKRADTTKGYAHTQGWSLYDKDTGFYMGMHMNTRKECEARARVYLSTATKEQLQKQILDIQVSRAKIMLGSG